MKQTIGINYLENEYLFDMPNSWEKNWEGMPKFYPPTRDTFKRNKIDVSDIQSIARGKTSIKNKYPIYIISKGRHYNPQTAIALDKLGIDYKVVIEPQEYSDYVKLISSSKILCLPFSNMGQGSIPARNWVLDHSCTNGDKRHWIMDDNINGFGLQKGGRRINTNHNGDFLSNCEEFVDRYTNVKIAGIRYRFHHNYVKAPYLLNTRIYSCILIDNSIKHRWRGKYNEDTDLSLRVLKDKDCTILFTWCYCNKAGTMTMRGGNTEELYQDDGRKIMAESLAQQHPDVASVSFKFNRWHHHVDYTPFKKNKLKELQQA